MNSSGLQSIPCTGFPPVQLRAPPLSLPLLVLSETLRARLLDDLALIQLLIGQR